MVWKTQIWEPIYLFSRKFLSGVLLLNVHSSSKIKKLFLNIKKILFIRVIRNLLRNDKTIRWLGNNDFEMLWNFNLNALIANLDSVHCWTTGDEKSAVLLCLLLRNILLEYCVNFAWKVVYNFSFFLTVYYILWK